MPTLAQATTHTVEDLGLVRGELKQGSGEQRPSLENNRDLVFTRCPIPPIQVSPDSVNLFGRNQRIPQDRILSMAPLFTESQQTGSSTSITNVSVFGTGSSSGSSGTSSTTTVSLSTSNTAVVTPVINQGESTFTTVQLSPSFLLFQVSVNSPCRVRLYSTAQAQAGDVGRSVDTPVPLGAPHGIIGDLNLVQPTDAVWMCSPVISGFNGDSPQTGSIYLTVTNQIATSVQITVSLVYVPLE
jgi:hypothetical protein